jgi:transcriptional regulator with XRE-family HTH domain
MTAVARRLDLISEKTGVKEREFAQLLDTTPQTIYRWRHGQVEPQSARLRRILDLAFAAEELSELYTPDEARAWLFSKNRILGGKRPVELIAEDNMDTVLQVISQLKDGAYA